MDNSVYIMLSRQMSQFRDMEITSNNIANVNTPGYNAQKLVFSQYLADIGKTGEKDAYADTPYAYRNTATGAIQNTGNTFDLAIRGDAYFQVETPLGTRFTKAGAFQVTPQGMLVTVDGYPVLGADGGQILIPPGSRNVVINGDGNVMVDGQNSGQVGIMEFTNQQSMKRFGNSLYSSDEAPTPSLTSRVVQGALETSNVSSVTELVRVMQISRDVAATSKFIETAYDLERKTSSTFTRSKVA